MHALKTSSGVVFNHNSDWSGDVKVVIPGMSVVIDIPGSALVELAAKVACARIEAFVSDKLYDVIIGDE